jgi:hypothetical protein
MSSTSSGGGATSGGSPEGDAIPRRDLLLGAAVGAAATAAVAVAGLPAAAGARSSRRKCKPARQPVPGPLAPTAAPDILMDTGVGMYTDASTAQMLSGFTICPEMLSCAVATPGLSDSGAPFAMLMYAVTIPLYVVDHANGVIRAAGRMRSRTVIATQTVEDIEHDFNAIAVDGRGNRTDRFDVHFSTPFWTVGKNPMATPSKDFPGKARFGGDLVMGKISVRR